MTRQISPRIHQLSIPFPGSPLRETYVYAVSGREGILLVDLGWESEESWTALLSGLSDIGAGVKDVIGVVLTHFHPDHSGLARRFRKESSAFIAMHERDLRLTGDGLDDRGRFIRKRMDAFAREAGAPRLTERESSSFTLSSLGPGAVQPVDRTCKDGDEPLPGVRILATPGHTPGHVAVIADDVALVGDHILPRITPNISAYAMDAGDPLGEYVASLRLLGTLPKATRLLPAHEGEVFRPAERIAQVLAHHERRLEEMLALLPKSGGMTAWEVTSALPWATPWSRLRKDPMRRAALGEAVSHLRYLALRGHAEQRRSGGAWRWTASGMTREKGLLSG